MKYELEHCWTRYGGFANRLMASLYLLIPLAARQKKGARLFGGYFKFGFVRNPWDRAVSLYERREGLQLRDVMSFEEFIEWMRFSSSTCIHPMPHRNQLDWFVDSHGQVQVDFIGRFETIDEDWSFIAQRLGLPPELPHCNRNPRRTKPYTDYYTPRTRQIVADRFREDIEYFGYEFGVLRPGPREDRLRKRAEPLETLRC